MKQGYISWRLFTKIVDELPSSTVVVPFFRGEALLHPRFADAMEKLQKFTSVQLATNGDFIDKRNQTAILKTCSFISLSLHEKRNSPHNGVAEFLCAAKKRGLTTQVSILDSLIPNGEKNEFVSDWLQHVDRVRVYVEHSHVGYGDTQLNIHDDGQPCSKPFTDMVVYWNGETALCCHDWNNKIPVGDLNKQSIGEVWNSQAYQDVRNKHQTGKRREVESCKNCHQWKADYMPNRILGELYTAR